MKQVEVTFGDKTYTITELPSRKNAEWRGKLEAILGEIQNMIAIDPDTPLSIEFIAWLLDKVKKYAVESVPSLTSLLFDYSPELAARRTEIEEVCYDSEIVDAFLQVLKLAFPFFGALPKIPESKKKSG